LPLFPLTLFPDPILLILNHYVHCVKINILTAVSILLTNVFFCNPDDGEVTRWGQMTRVTR